MKEKLTIGRLRKNGFITIRDHQRRNVKVIKHLPGHSTHRGQIRLGGVAIICGLVENLGEAVYQTFKIKLVYHALFRRGNFFKIKLLSYLESI